jgi:hypothetical protein
MILGAGLLGLAVATAFASNGSSGHSSSKTGMNHPQKTTPFKATSHRSDLTRGEVARVLAQKSTGKGNSNKGKSDPNKGKFDPNKGKSDPNKGKKGDPNGKGIGKGLNAQQMAHFFTKNPISGNAFNGLKPKQKDSIRAFALSKNITPVQQGALNKINNGQALSPQDRQTLTGLVNNPPADMTPEVREAINAALTLDANTPKHERTTRILQLYNGTDEAMKVWVQYHTYTDKNTWSWFPTPPAAESPKAVVYDLKAGKSTKLVDGNDGWIIHASRVRVWGKTSSGMVLDEFRKSDLLLVPETNPKGEHAYFAAEQETFTYTFAAPADSVATKQ